MAAPDKPNPYASDVLHAPTHSKLSTAEIAKAVARHKREHPSKGRDKTQPQKTAPRR